MQLLLWSVVHTNGLSVSVICRSVCAYPKNPAGGSWGGSALSQPAHPDQAMSHKALLYMAAEWLVSMHCGGMTYIVNARFKVFFFLLPWCDHELTKGAHLHHEAREALGLLVFKWVQFGMTSHWISTFLKGTLWGFWSLELWSNAFLSGSPFCLHMCLQIMHFSDMDWRQIIYVIFFWKIAPWTYINVWSPVWTSY